MALMVITHHGIQSFKVSFGDITLALDPVSKDSKKGSPWRGGSDITLISLNNPDMNGSDSTSRGDKESFVVSGPGEYEIKGVFIKGAETVSNYSGKESINTIYTISLENMNLCFLGALGNTKMGEHTREIIDNVDILFVPVGEGTLEPSDAYKFAVSLEPSIIIPMNYSDTSLKAFLKEAGASAPAADKLTIKKKDLEGKQAEIVVLRQE